MDNKLDALNLKMKLQCLGLRAELALNLDKGRITGAGPAGGRYFILPEGVVANIPLQGDFVRNSPYRLSLDKENNYIINDGADLHFRVEIIPPPKFYKKNTSLNIPMEKIALVHGKDCLATTVNPSCIYWRDGSMCQFCGIEVPLQLQLSIGKKNPQQLGEVLKAAREEGVCSHVTLTCGENGLPDRGSQQYYPFINVIKECGDIPIYAQISPPYDLNYIDKLADLGVDSIGINIESFDPVVFSKICPGKAKDANRDQYYKSWEYSIKLFGENQVSTFLILGMGENLEYTKKGIEDLARLGGIVFPVPLRRVYGSLLQHLKPPEPEYIMSIARMVADIHHDYGLDPNESKAGCVRCGACGII